MKTIKQIPLLRTAGKILMVITLISMPVLLFSQEPPSANAGEDFTACENEIMLSGTAENYESILWTTLGDGTFDDPGSLNTSYTPGTGDLSLGEAELCLTAFSGGDEATDCIIVTIVPLPQLEIIPDEVTVCYDEVYPITDVEASNVDAIQWFTINGGGFFDNENILNPVYYPSPTADYPQGCIIIGVVAQGFDPCSLNTEDQFNLCFQPPAQVDLGGDTHYACFDLNYTFEEATITGESFLQWVPLTGGGYFENPNSINATYVPDPEFDYPQECIIVVLFAESMAPCTTSIEEYATICFTGPPEASAGSDATIFSDESFVPDAVVSNEESILWVSSGDGTFSDPSIATPNYYPGIVDQQTGSATLTLTAFPKGNCPEPAVDELQLDIITHQDIELQEGAGSFSSYVNTQGLSFEELIAPVSGDLVFAQYFNQVYWPAYGINTIVDFSNLKGYRVVMSNATILPVTGTKTAETTVDLPVGWSILPVPVSCTISDMEVIGQLGASLIIITEIEGEKVLWPAGGTYTLTQLVPGKAYMIKMAAPAQLDFQVCE